MSGLSKNPKDVTFLDANSLLRNCVVLSRSLADTSLLFIDSGFFGAVVFLKLFISIFTGFPSPVSFAMYWSPSGGLTFTILTISPVSIFSCSTGTVMSIPDLNNFICAVASFIFINLLSTLFASSE